MAGEIFFDNGGSAEAIRSTLQPGSLAITLYDFNEDGSNSHVTATPDEWDAFVAAGDRALGRPPPALPVTATTECNGNTFSIRVRGTAEPAPVATPLEERVAEAAKAAVAEGHRLAYDETSRLRAYGRGEGLRAALAMVREAGPTVPRAAVEALRDTILGWEKAALPGSYEDGRAQGLLDVVAVIDTMLGTKEPGHADD